MSLEQEIAGMVPGEHSPTSDCRSCEATFLASPFRASLLHMQRPKFRQGPCNPSLKWEGQGDSDIVPFVELISADDA